jgi:hypothetical protein
MRIRAVESSCREPKMEVMSGADECSLSFLRCGLRPVKC